MQKIVINKKYGGFNLSDAAMQEYAKRKGMKLYSHTPNSLLTHYTLVPWTEYVAMDNYNPKKHDVYVSTSSFERDDPILVSIVEDLGSEKCSGDYAKLVIVEIPDKVKWEIQEYDGMEWVAEIHRTWD